MTCKTKDDALLKRNVLGKIALYSSLDTELCVAIRFFTKFYKFFGQKCDSVDISSRHPRANDII